MLAVIAVCLASNKSHHELGGLRRQPFSHFWFCLVCEQCRWWHQDTSVTSGPLVMMEGQHEAASTYKTFFQRKMNDWEWNATEAPSAWWVCTRTGREGRRLYGTIFTQGYEIVGCESIISYLSKIRDLQEHWWNWWKGTRETDRLEDRNSNVGGTKRKK